MPPASFPFTIVYRMRYAHLGLLSMFSAHAMRIWAYYVYSAHVQHAIISLYIGLHSCHLHRLHNLQLNTVSVFATQFLFK